MLSACTMKYEKVARLVAKQARPSRIKSGTVIPGAKSKIDHLLQKNLSQDACFWYPQKVPPWGPWGHPLGPGSTRSARCSSPLVPWRTAPPTTLPPWTGRCPRATRAGHRNRCHHHRPCLVEMPMLKEASYADLLWTCVFVHVYIYIYSCYICMYV